MQQNRGGGSALGLSDDALRILVDVDCDFFVMVFSCLL